MSAEPMMTTTKKKQERPNPDSARNLLDLLLLRGLEPERVAGVYKASGHWCEAPWSEVVERSRRLAAGLTAMGIARGDRIAIFSATRYEWTLASFAILGAGAIVVPLYASNTPSECEHILANSGARAVFIDSNLAEGRLAGRLDRVLEVRAHLPELKLMVGMDLASDPAAGLVSLEALEERGEAETRAHPRALEEMAASLGPDDLSFIIYTSGTTGAPKGVMLTHENWTSQAKSVNQLGLLIEGDTVLLFLPLAHSFALVVLAAWLGVGMRMAFAESIERAVDNAAEVKATVLPAVPRVFEKAFNKVVSDGSAQPGIKGRLFSWAMQLFDQYADARAAGREFTSVQWTLAKRLVFSKIEGKLKARFGGHMREFISGGAPLSKKIGYFFQICGLLVCEGYGLTETSAPTHCNLPTDNRVGTVGPPFPGVQVRIAEDGEVLVRGPQVMKGYFGMPEATREVLEADGWFHTGDIGEQDADGYLKITDRKKDLIKTSGGKYIAPQELENALKSEPFVSQVFVHGDRRKFVSAIITVNEENVRKWAVERGLSDGFRALTQRPEVRARIQTAVDALNAQLPSYATIKRFVVLDHDWAQDTGEMTPTLKVKRKVVAERYKAELDALYAE